MTTEIWLALVSTASAIITGIIAYVKDRQLKNKDVNIHIIDSLLNRVDDLEQKLDATQNAVKDDEKRRRDLAIEYESRIEQIRKEMKRMLDETSFELATWRDKYYTLIDEYQKLKLEHSALSTKFVLLEQDYKKLEKRYGELREKFEKEIG